VKLSLPQIRVRYRESVGDREEAEALWRKFKDYRGEDGVILAYKAATRILMSHHSWMPMEKLAYLKEAMHLFRQAVSYAPDNIEVRFLRFSIEHRLPAYLDESRNLEEDKAVILASAERYQDFSLNRAELEAMFDFFEACDRFTKAELAQLRAVVK
jgi:tetratricopeptide (TPR) repeat protein